VLRQIHETWSEEQENSAVSSVDMAVSCYRYGHFLRKCVESVLNQSDVSIRLPIIDDASPNNTREVATALAREDSRVSVIYHSTNKGHISTYNEGVEWASSDYMLLLIAKSMEWQYACLLLLRLRS